MAPSFKNNKPNGVLNPANWNNRIPTPTESSYDFYNKSNAGFHGFLYSNLNYVDASGTAQLIPLTGGNSGKYNGGNAMVLCVGPYNEITIQKIGTTGTVTIQGSMLSDINTVVTCNTVTSADGLIRIQSLYKFLFITAASLDATSQLYIQIW
jgi:hypothetical protein